MARFDFVESASKAYQYAWDNKQDLARPSAFVLLAKIVCFVFVLGFGLEQNFLRQGLVLLPSYFVEGWIIAHIMLKALSTEEDSAYQIPAISPDNVQRAVLVSTVVYVLLKLVLSVLIGMPASVDLSTLPADRTPAEPTAGMFGMLVMFSVFLVWAFRFLWLYIPPALGFTVKDYLLKVRPFTSSLYMLGLWVLCFVPLGLLLIMASEIASAPFTAPTGDVDAIPTLQKYILTFVHGGFDYIMVLISSLGMAYGVASMFNKQDKNISLL